METKPALGISIFSTNIPHKTQSDIHVQEVIFENNNHNNNHNLGKSIQLKIVTLIILCPLKFLSV